MFACPLPLALLLRALPCSATAPFPPCSAKLAERFASSGGAARIGGKGTVRRKKMAVHKVAAVDDKKLTAALKKTGAMPLAGVEEVNFFQEDNSVLHFRAPKVQAAHSHNMHVVVGDAVKKQLQDLLPGILGQMGPSGLKALTDAVAKGQVRVPGGGALTAAQQAQMAQMAQQMAAAGADEEDLPQLEGNFEAPS